MRSPQPRHPSDLVRHDCLVFLPIGPTWSFETGSGAVAAEVRARFAANDSRVLLSAALTGLGIAVLPQFLAARGARPRAGCEPVLPDYPLTPIWFKAMVPRNKVHHPVVAALVDHLKGEFGPVPPWDR